jgi:solute carrier family 25 carnitine/acylcarnitine transporter 20/29
MPLLFATRVVASLLLIPFIAGSSLTPQSQFASAQQGEEIASSPVNPSSVTVIDILSSSAEHTILLHLLQRCKLVPTLNLMQGITLFAPTDDAWQAWANQRTATDERHHDAEILLSQIITSYPSSEPDDLADNILFETHQLLLYHMLNYTLPVAKHSLTAGTPKQQDRWIARNVSTETTLLFPSRTHHPPSNMPPPHPPWSPLGGTGTLGGKGQKLRLNYDFDESCGPNLVQVNAVGNGGIEVWTHWSGNHTEKDSHNGRYRLGSNGLVIGLRNVLETPPDLG